MYKTSLLIQGRSIPAKLIADGSKLPLGRLLEQLEHVLDATGVARITASYEHLGATMEVTVSEVKSDD